LRQEKGYEQRGGESSRLHLLAAEKKKKKGGAKVSYGGTRGK